MKEGGREGGRGRDGGKEGGREGGKEGGREGGREMELINILYQNYYCYIPCFKAQTISQLCIQGSVLADAI